MQLKNDASMETFATKSITKIDKYKKKNGTALLRMNTKQKRTLLKLTSTKKLNSTSMTEHKTEFVTKYVVIKRSVSFQYIFLISTESSFKEVLNSTQYNFSKEQFKGKGFLSFDYFSEKDKIFETYLFLWVTRHQDHMHQNHVYLVSQAGLVVASLTSLVSFPSSLTNSMYFVFLVH